MSDIRRVAVIGAGIMGHGIAQVCAQSGYETVIVATKPESLARAISKIKENLEVFREVGLVTEGGIKEVMGRLSTTTSIEEAVRNADFVIETTTESVDIKRDVFTKVDQSAPPHAIIGTNTSTIKISLLASFTKRPHMVVGVHFWNPPHLMPLVEIVKSEYTSEEVVGKAKAFVESLGKVPVICKKDVPGFLGVRLQAAIVLEAIRMLEEGIASAEDIDTAVKLTLGLRYPIMGPLQVVDFGGVDTFYYAYDYLHRATGLERFRPPELLKKMVERGELGIKTGKGFYAYTPEQIAEMTKLRDKWLLEELKKRGLIKIVTKGSAP